MYQNVAILLNGLARGGTERAVANLANIFAERGLNVHIISTTTTEGTCPYPLHDSVKLFHAGITYHDKKRLGWLKYVRKVNRYLRDNGIQIAFGAGRQVCMMMYFFDRSITKVACEHFNYQSLMEHKSFGRLLNAVRKFVYKRMDALVCLTRGDAENYYAFMEREKVFVIPNSLSFPRDTVSELNTKRIIAVGHLNKQKNFSALIESARIMKREIPEWRVTIFGKGNGNEEHKLQRLIAEKSLEDFVFIHEPVSDIKSEYLSSSIMAMSSLWEGLPMVLIEAESCGLPVVSFNCNYGPSDMIHDGINGYLVDVGDVQGLAERIISLAKNDELRRKMGEASFDNSALYETDRIAEKWMDLLNRI